jgi:hypothetical protein
MITLKDFMEIVNYRITEGSNYGWDCYGPNAYILDSWDGEQDGNTISIVFDTKTQEVYEVTAYDYDKDRAFRIINPAYKQAHVDEGKARAILDCAWEQDDGTPVKFTDLEVDEDFVEKASAIANGEEYGDTVMVPLNLDKEQLYELMLIAHQRNVTLNQMVEDVLRLQIERLENEDTISQ